VQEAVDEGELCGSGVGGFLISLRVGPLLAKLLLTRSLLLLFHTFNAKVRVFSM